MIAIAGACSLAGAFGGLLLSAEEPIWTTKRKILIGVSLALLLAVGVMVEFARSRGDLLLRRRAWLVCGAFWLAAASWWLWTPSFDSATWKASRNDRRLFNGGQTYSAGQMAQNLVESGLLIGKSEDAVSQLLGLPTFVGVRERYPRCPVDASCLYYGYDNFPDGCDKVQVAMRGGRCVSAEITGCD